MMSFAHRGKLEQMGQKASFRLGILASFSGQPALLADQRPRRVDRDSLDEVFHRISPRLELGLPFCDELRLERLDDFHPDRIAQRVPALSKLLQARNLVDQPEQMRGLIGQSGFDLLAPTAVDAPAPEPAAQEGSRRSEPEQRAAERDENLLDELLGHAEAAPMSDAPRGVGDPALAKVINEIAEASADRTDYATQERWRSALDTELGVYVRRILHHPRTRSLEATWRSLRRLVYAADTDERLRIEILDVDAAALRSEGQRLHELIHEEAAGTPGGEAFSLLVLDRIIEENPEDLDLLRTIARAASEARVPVLTGAGESLCTKDIARSSEWQELRSSPEARWVGLCLPRILLRLPYGAVTDPIDGFAFEESPSEGESPVYLWGNAAHLAASAIARCIHQTGSLAAIGTYTEFESLPFHVFQAEGETRHREPTERLLSEAELKQRIEDGLIPLAGYLGRDVAVLTSLRSLAGTALIEG